MTTPNDSDVALLPTLSGSASGPTHCDVCEAPALAHGKCLKHCLEALDKFEDQSKKSKLRVL